MSLTYIPVVGTFAYRDADATPAAGEAIHFIPVSEAIVDGAAVTLPKKLICTLNADGEIPAGFELPTVGDGVYYKVIEKFAGGRSPYTIQVLTTDDEIDLATVAPVIPVEEMASYVRVDDIGVTVASQEDLEALAVSGVSDGDKGGVVVSGSGSVWTVKPTPFASAAQGALADTAVQPGDLSAVATSGAYADLSGKPTLGTAAAAATTDFATASQGTKADNAQVGIQFKDDGTNRGSLGAVTSLDFTGSGVTASIVGTALTVEITGTSGGGGASAAVDVSVADVGDYFAGTNAEAVLQEVGATLDGLGTAATTDASDYATAAQGALADSAIQAADLGSAAYESATAFDVNGAASAAQAAAIAASAPSTHVGAGGTEHALAVSSGAAGFMSGTDKAKLDGIASGAEVNVNADWDAVSGDAQILNKPTLGSAAAADTGDFATAAQGALADSALQPNAPITGATKTKITYDADGLVTAGADATTADIADSTNKRYVTDAQLTVIGNTSGTNTGDQDLSGYLLSATAATTYQGILSLSANTFYARSSSGAAANKTISDFGLSLVDDADASAARTTLGLGTAATTAATAYATSTQGTTADNALPKAGGTMSGAINCADNNLQRPLLLDYAVVRQAKGSISGSQTIDITAGNAVSATATGAIAWTFSNPSPTGNLCAVFLRLTNGGAGAQTWPTGTVWDSATAPTLSASGVDELLFLTSDAGTTWRGFLCAKGQA